MHLQFYIFFLNLSLKSILAMQMISDLVATLLIKIACWNVFWILIAKHLNVTIFNYTLTCKNNCWNNLIFWIDNDIIKQLTFRSLSRERVTVKHSALKKNLYFYLSPTQWPFGDIWSRPEFTVTLARFRQTHAHRCTSVPFIRTYTKRELGLSDADLGVTFYLV